MAVALELALHNTTEPSGRYVGWAPAPASLRVLDADGAETPIAVRLDSPGTAGRVVFAAEHGSIWLSSEPADAPTGQAPVTTEKSLYS